MKILNCFLGVVFILITLSVNTQPQNRDSLIKLYPGMVDTLDLIDREIFEIYPDIEGFEFAQLYSRDKKFFVSKITFSTHYKSKDKVLIEDISVFKDLQMRLYQIILNNEKSFRSPLNASVYLNTGNNYDGKLEMFSKHYLYMNSDQNYLSADSSQLRFKTPFISVDSLKIQGLKPNLGPYLGYGALGGSILGFVIGYATFDDDWGLPKESKWLISAGIGAGIGFFLGWIIGEVVSPGIITLKINTPNDILKIKQYAPYYFNYRKSLEESYVELE